MIFTESIYRTNIMYKTILHDMVKFHNCWASVLVDINVIPMTIRIQGKFHYLNSTEV